MDMDQNFHLYPSIVGRFTLGDGKGFGVSEHYFHKIAERFRRRKNLLGHRMNGEPVVIRRDYMIGQTGTRNLGGNGNGAEEKPPTKKAVHAAVLPEPFLSVNLS